MRMRHVLPIVVTISVIACCVFAWRAYRAEEAVRELTAETTVLSKIRVGMSRQQVYELARSAHTSPLVGHNIGLDSVDGPASNPEREKLHPSVELFFNHYLEGLLLWPYDDVTIYFDNNDRVEKWKVTTWQTGV
jgi:hypothetical protein